MNFGGSALWPVVSTMLHEPLGGAEPRRERGVGSRRRCSLAARRGRCSPPTSRSSAASRADDPRLDDGRVRARRARRRPAPRARASPGRPTATTRSATRSAPSIRAAAAVPARLDVPRPLAARVPAGRRLRTGVHHDLRRAARSRSTPRTGKTRVALQLRPLRLGVARARRPPRLRDVHREPRMRLARGATARSPRSTRGPDALRWLRQIGPTESSPLVARGIVFVGDWNGRVWALDGATGRTRWTADLDGAIKGSLALSGQPALHRHVRRRRRLARCTDRAGAVALGRPRPVLLVARGRVRTRVHRLARRRRLRIRRDDGRPPLGASDRRLRLRLAGGLAQPRARRLLRPPLLRASMRHGRGALALRRKRADLRRGERRSTASSTSRRFGERTLRARAATAGWCTTWPDGKYSPVVADATHLYLVGLGRLYALTSAG